MMIASDGFFVSSRPVIGPYHKCVRLRAIMHACVDIHAAARVKVRELLSLRKVKRLSCHGHLTPAKGLTNSSCFDQNQLISIWSVSIWG